MRPNRRDFLKGLGLGAGALGWSGLVGGKVRAAGRKPNIILIMSDDMGFSDFG
ncbi:MAG: twin-arginine translocation signal domain-containing protein, partial [Planctomycetota bacterium]